MTTSIGDLVPESVQDRNVRLAMRCAELKRENERLIEGRDQMLLVGEQQEAEVERLRGEMGTLIEVNKSLRAQIERLQKPPAASTGEANTHYAVVATSVPPSMTIIAHGPEDFCRTALDRWVEGHPLGEFETAEILAKTSQLAGTTVGTDDLKVFYMHNRPVRQEDAARAEQSFPCAGCGLDLSETAPDDDGHLTCPECGHVEAV